MSSDKSYIFALSLMINYRKAMRATLKRLRSHNSEKHNQHIETQINSIKTNIPIQLLKSETTNYSQDPHVSERVLTCPIFEKSKSLIPSTYKQRNDLVDGSKENTTSMLNIHLINPKENVKDEISIYSPKKIVGEDFLPLAPPSSFQKHLIHSISAEKRKKRSKHVLFSRPSVFKRVPSSQNDSFFENSPENRDSSNSRSVVLSVFDNSKLDVSEFKENQHIFLNRIEERYSHGLDIFDKKTRRSCSVLQKVELSAIKPLDLNIKRVGTQTSLLEQRVPASFTFDDIVEDLFQPEKKQIAVRLASILRTWTKRNVLLSWRKNAIIVKADACLEKLILSTRLTPETAIIRLIRVREAILIEKKMKCLNFINILFSNQKATFFVLLGRFRSNIKSVSQLKVIVNQLMLKQRETYKSFLTLIKSQEALKVQNTNNSVSNRCVSIMIMKIVVCKANFRVQMKALCQIREYVTRKTISFRLICEKKAMFNRIEFIRNLIKFSRKVRIFRKAMRKSDVKNRSLIYKCFDSIRFFVREDTRILDTFSFAR